MPRVGGRGVVGEGDVAAEPDRHARPVGTPGTRARDRPAQLLDPGAASRRQGRRVLHSAEGRRRRQLGEKAGGEVVPRLDGLVVEAQGQDARGRDRPDESRDLGIHERRVGERCEQQPVGPRTLRGSRVLEHLPRGGCADGDVQGHGAAGLPRRAHDAVALGRVERPSVAARREHDDAVDAGADRSRDELAQRPERGRPLVVERRDRVGEEPGEGAHAFVARAGRSTRAMTTSSCGSPPTT